VKTVSFPLPRFIRLPRSGARCPITGLSRTGLNQLVLPCQANGLKPPVRSFVLRKPGARTGVRLIDVQSLIAYVESHGHVGGTP